ncbi:MAG: YceI family protein [Nitriliruptoraceae bacterium]|nr:YceI family protein [Nitriliruptoraceae bacterium]
MTTDTVTLPQTGTWIIDASHSSIEFVAKHLMVSKVRGRFSAFSGTVTVAEPLENSAVSVSIDAASISTGDEQRDGHVKSEDFLQVESFPTIGFSSSSIQAKGDGYILPGELTIKDVTRAVELDVEFMGVYADPWGNPKAAFSASTEIDREDWGITWNAALETGGVLVSKTVKIELDVQLQPQGDDA